MILHDVIPGTDFHRTWSDLGRNLLQKETGIVYGDSVIDHISHSYTYEEVLDGLEDEIDSSEALRLITDTEPGENDDITDEQAVNIILGEDEDNDTETGNGNSEND